jgi:signal transduction histidine kinase
MPASSTEQLAARQSPWWWAPLALIALTLVVLFGAPFISNGRLRTVRQHESEVTSPALIRVNDLEAALATETAARSEAQFGSQTTDAQTTATAARLLTVEDEHVLDSLVRRIGPDAVSLFADAKLAIDDWQAAEDRFVRDTRSRDVAISAADLTAVRIRRWTTVQIALQKMQRLEDNLSAHAAAERAAIASLEQLDLLVPAALVPLALLALIAVAWTARRTQALSLAALEGQRTAEQAMAAKSALMRGVTHDLKNPLGAARGYAELLTDGTLGPLPDGQTRVIARMQRLLSLTLDTVNDLVELSRADAGQLRIEREAADVVAIVRDAVEDYRPTGENAGVELIFDNTAAGHTGSLVVVTDATRVRQVLGNMLSNAVKYTPRGGAAHICISTGDDDALGAVVAVRVADSGSGVAEPYRERVFEEFFRVPNASVVAAGTGIGLAIARRIARLLDGDLRLTETPGGGATFTLFLPRSTQSSS